MSLKRNSLDEEKFDQPAPHVLERGGVLQGFTEGYNVPYQIGSDSDDRYNFSAADTELVARKLKQRHIQMCVFVSLRRDR